MPPREGTRQGGERPVILNRGLLESLGAFDQERKEYNPLQAGIKARNRNTSL